MVNIILYKLYSQLYDQEYFEACLSCQLFFPQIISEFYFDILYILC